MVWDVMFTCDICGKTKGEANHWWMAALVGTPAIHKNGKASRTDRFTLMPWNPDESRNPDMSSNSCGHCHPPYPV